MGSSGGDPGRATDGEGIDREVKGRFCASIMNLRGWRVQQLEMHRGFRVPGRWAGRWISRWTGGQVRCAAAGITKENGQEMSLGAKQGRRGKLRNEAWGRNKLPVKQ